MKNYPSLMNARIVIRKKKRKPQAPKPKKTAFVKFFESLQNRGPITNSLYEKWTANVRSEMEEHGTWPKPDDEANIEFIAEYIARLQRQFWITNSDFHWYHTKMEYEWHKLGPSIRLFKLIFSKIRMWGMRNHLYQTNLWYGTHTLRYTNVIGYSRRWRVDDGILIHPHEFEVDDPLRKYS